MNLQKEIEKLIKSNIDNIPLELKELVQFLSLGEYEVGNIHFTDHDENTRFVIVEKYNLFDKFSSNCVYMNVEIFSPVQMIKTNLTITKDNVIE